MVDSEIVAISFTEPVDPAAPKERLLRSCAENGFENDGGVNLRERSDKPDEIDFLAGVATSGFSVVCGLGAGAAGCTVAAADWRLSWVLRDV